MSTDQPSVPVAHATTNKLQLENQSLKRRLVQYAATLEKLTTHAKREIDQSTRARDEALSRAADASALRQKLSTMNASLTNAQSTRDTATASLHRAEARVEQLQATLASLQRRLDDARYDDTQVASMREELLSLRKEMPNLRRLREQDASRALTLNDQLEVEKQKSATYDSMVLRLQQMQTENSQLVTDRDAVQLSLSNLRRSESSATRERDDVIVKLRESQDMNDMLRQQLHQLQDRVRLLEQRIKDAEATEIRRDNEVADAKRQSDNAVSALRTELDSALKDLGDRNTMYDELKEKHDRSIDAESALAERDSMQSNIRQLQIELDQSTEMLTRAAIDALADKGKIRKLEDSLSKLRAEVDGERKEKGMFETRTVNLTQQMAALEGELDQVRTSKRELADECHKYQLQIHERDSVVASKNRALEELDTDRNDRTFQIDRLKLELSNSKNALAKKESDLMKLTTEYEDLCSVIKSTNRDLDDKHSEVAGARREVAAANDQVSKLTQERDHLKVTVAELQVASRQVEELSALVSSKDDEIGSMKRWCTSLKAEAGESVREKKRLSDMLSDVSGDLKRANQELALLRNMRREQEILAHRISQIGETSSRELNDMRKSQSEQAEVLAKSTVEAYQGRLVELQKSAHHEIADTVSTQLRDDIMPHLMRAVDAKARNLVHALAKHVESFTLDDATPDAGAKDHARPMPSTKAEVAATASVDRSTYATSASASRSVSLSAPPSVPPPGTQSAAPLSATESPSISLANASHGDYTGMESTAEPSAITSDRSVEAIRVYGGPSSVPTATSSAQGVPSETVEFQSEGVDMTDDIDPVAIHNRLTETYKQLLGGRTDLDLDEFQTSPEVIEQNVASRQVTSVSAEPIAQEQSEKIAAEAPAMDELPVGTRDIPSVAVEQLDAPQPQEEPLEIVESYVPKEGEVDESLEDGEGETEEDAPEEQEPEATSEPADDTAEEFKDALAEVVPVAPNMDAAVEVPEEIVHEEDDETNEPSTAEEPQELSRGFRFEQAEPIETEVETEKLTQTETEKELQQTAEVDTSPTESAPVADVVALPEVVPEPKAEEHAEAGVAADDTNVEEDIEDDAPEPVEEVHDVALSAEMQVQDEPREPADSEEALEGEGLIAGEREYQFVAPEPIEPEEEDTTDAVDEVKQDQEESAADDGLPQEEEEDFEDVLHGASKEIEVAAEDAADETTQDQEEVAAGDDLPQEREDPDEIDPVEVVFDASQEIEAAVEDSEDETEQEQGEVMAGEEHEDSEEVFDDASREIEAAVGGSVDETKQEQEVVAADDDVPHKLEDSADVVDDAPRDAEATVEDAVDETQPDREEIVADAYLPREPEEPEEAFHDAPREIESVVENVPEQVEEITEVEAQKDEPLGEAREHLPEEVEEEDHPLTEEGGDEPRAIVTVADAQEDDDDGEGEQEPIEEELQSDKVPQEIEVPDVVEEDEEKVVSSAAPEPEHESAPEQPADDSVEASSGLPTDALEDAVIDDDVVMGSEQPRGLDLSAATKAVSEDIPTTTEAEQPTTSEDVVEQSGALGSAIEEHAVEADEMQAELQENRSGTVEDPVAHTAPLESSLPPLESSLPAEGVLGSDQVPAVDLSSGYEEAIPAAKNVLLSTEEEVVEETSTAAQPGIPSHDDEDVVPGGVEDEGEALEDATSDPVDVQESLPRSSLVEEETREEEKASPIQETLGVDVEDEALGEDEHVPRADHDYVGETTGIRAEGTQGLQEDDDVEDIEVVDATRDDYGADVELETEPPVMAFPTLNVVEEEDILEDDEDDDFEDDEDDNLEDDRDVRQDGIEELDLTEGVPADLDDHSDLDEEYEDVVNGDAVYGHAVVEELAGDVEEEDISATAEHEAQVIGGEDEAEALSTEQDIYKDAKGSAAVMEEKDLDALSEEQRKAAGGKQLLEVSKEEEKAEFRDEFMKMAMKMEAAQAAAATAADAEKSALPGGDVEAKVDDSVEGENILRA